MAAAAVTGVAGLAWTRSENGCSAAWPATSQEVDQVSQHRRPTIHRPLALPNPTRKRSRPSHASPEKGFSVSEDIRDLNREDRHAQRRVPRLRESEWRPLPPPKLPQRRVGPNDSLLTSSIPEHSCDFASEDGYVQHGANKKKKRANQSSNFNAPSRKDSGGPGDGGSGGGNNQNGDAGRTGGGHSGRGDEDDKKDSSRDPNSDNDAEFGTFATLGKKKKGSNETDQVNDLLDRGSKPSTNPVHSWGTVWNTGQTDHSGTRRDDEIGRKKNDINSEAWGSDPPQKSKRGKVGFGFGSFDEPGERKTEWSLEEENGYDVESEFPSIGKTEKKKRNVWNSQDERSHDSFLEAHDTTAADDGSTPCTATHPYRSKPIPPTQDDDFWANVDLTDNPKGKKKPRTESHSTTLRPASKSSRDDTISNSPLGETKKDKEGKKNAMAAEPEPEASQESASKSKESVLHTVPESKPQPAPVVKESSSWFWGATKKVLKVMEPLPSESSLGVENHDESRTSLEKTDTKTADDSFEEAHESWGWFSSKSGKKKSNPATSHVDLHETALHDDSKAQDTPQVEAKQDAAAEELAAQITKEENELVYLETKQKKKRLSSKDQKRYDELVKNARDRLQQATVTQPVVVVTEKVETNVDADALRAQEFADDAADAEIAAEEEKELESLKAKEKKRKKLTFYDQERLEELTQRANARIAAAAAAETRKRDRSRDVYSTPDVEKRTIGESEEPVAHEFEGRAANAKTQVAREVDIAAEEAELDKLKAKASRLLKRNRELSFDDQQRLDELSERATARAAEAAARELEELKAREAEENAAREARERAAAEAREAKADEAELKALKSKHLLLGKDKKRIKELTERINSRMAAADLDKGNTQTVTDELSAPKIKQQVASKTDEQARLEAARKAEEAKDDEDLEILTKRLKRIGRLSPKDKEQFDRLTKKVNARLAAKDENAQATPEFEEDAIAKVGELDVEVEEPTFTSIFGWGGSKDKKKSPLPPPAPTPPHAVLDEVGPDNDVNVWNSRQVDLEEDDSAAVWAAGAGSHEDEFGFLPAHKQRKSLSSKIPKRFDDPLKNEDSRAEQTKAKLEKEHADREAQEIEASRKAAEAREDAELEALSARLKKMKRPSQKDELRLKVLKAKVKARIAAREAERENLQTVKETEELTIHKDRQSADHRFGFPAHEDDRDFTSKGGKEVWPDIKAEAAHKTDHYEDDAELQALEAKLYKNGRLSPKDRQRYEVLTEKFNSRTAAIDPWDVPAVMEEEAAREAEVETLPKIDEQSASRADEEEESHDSFWAWGSSKKTKKSPPLEPAQVSHNMDEENLDNIVKTWDNPQKDPSAAELLAENAAEEKELAFLKSQKRKWGLSSKDQKRLDELVRNAKRRADEAAVKEAEEQERARLAALKEAEEKERARLAALKEAEEKEQAEREAQSAESGWGWGFSLLDRKPSRGALTVPRANTPPPIDVDEVDPNLGNATQSKSETEQDSAAAALAAQIALEETEIASLQAQQKKKSLSSRKQRRLDELLRNADDRAEQAAAKEAEEKERAEQAALKEAEERERAEREAESMEYGWGLGFGKKTKKISPPPEPIPAPVIVDEVAQEHDENVWNSHPPKTQQYLSVDIMAEEEELAEMQARKRLGKGFSSRKQKRFDELMERAAIRAEMAAIKEAEEKEHLAKAALEAEERERAEQAALKEAEEKKLAEQAALEAEEKARAEQAAKEAEEKERAEREAKATEASWLWGFSRKDKKKSVPSEPSPPSVDENKPNSSTDANVAGDAAFETQQDQDPAAAALLAQIVAEENELALLQAQKRKKGLSTKSQKRLEELTKNANDRAEQASVKRREEKEQAENDALAIEAARKAEEAKDDEQLEALKAKLSRKKRLSTKDQERFDKLTEKINARSAIPEQIPQETQELALQEQAAWRVDEQVTYDAEHEKDLTKLAALESKRKRDRKLSTKDQERFERITDRINARTAAMKARKSVENLAALDSERVLREKPLKQASRPQSRSEWWQAEDAAATSRKSKSGSPFNDVALNPSAKERKDEIDDIDLDDVNLTVEQANEILSDSPVAAKPKGNDPFAFWGAKHILKAPPPGAIITSQLRHSASMKFASTEKPKSPKDDAHHATKPVDSGSLDDEKISKAKTKGTKIAEKMQKFEPEKEEIKADVVDLPKPPASIPWLSLPWGSRSTEAKSSSQPDNEVPGNFPTDDDHDIAYHDDYKYEDQINQTVDKSVEESKSEKIHYEDDIDRLGEDEARVVDIVPFSPPEEQIPKKSKKSKNGKYRDEILSPVPPAAPHPPPAAPESSDAFASHPFDARPSRRERVKVNNDWSTSGDMLSGSTSYMEETMYSRSWSDNNNKVPRREREEKFSYRGSGSDQAEPPQDHMPVRPASRSRMHSVFQSTPPISRATSSRNRFASKPSSRRQSFDMSGGLASPYEEMPEVTSKAARFLGVDESFDRRDRFTRASAREEDIVRASAPELSTGPERLMRKRSKVRHHDDMDIGGPVHAMPPKRSDTGGKRGVFGGPMPPPPRPEPRRRNTYHATDDEGRADKRAKHARRMSSVERDVDPEREARRAARKARKEQDKLEEAMLAKEARREKRRRQEEEEREEMRRQEEREARRAERRAAREREAQRLAQEEAEAKEAERAERRRRRKLEKEAAAAAEEAEAEAHRAARAERRRSRHAGASEDEEERRRRRDARRAEKSSRHRSVPVPMEYAYVKARPARYTDDERRKTTVWTHAEQGMPVEPGPRASAPQVMEEDEARRAARRAARHQEKYYGTPGYEDDKRRSREKYYDPNREYDERRSREKYYESGREYDERRSREKYYDSNREYEDDKRRSRDKYYDSNREYEDERKRRREKYYESSREHEDDKRRSREKYYGEFEERRSREEYHDPEEERRRRRARREERERRERRVGESDGSGERAQREAAMFGDNPRSSWWKKLTKS